VLVHRMFVEGADLVGLGGGDDFVGQCLDSPLLTSAQGARGPSRAKARATAPSSAPVDPSMTVLFSSSIS